MMKLVRFKKSINPDRRLKNFSICHEAKDKKCVTRIRKSFIYKIKEVEGAPKALETPEIYIKKNIDSKTHIECFRLRVKGSFYMMFEKGLIEVCFYHTLNVKMFWKAKYFSPKKSVVLTE